MTHRLCSERRDEPVSRKQIGKLAQQIQRDAREVDDRKREKAEEAAFAALAASPWGRLVMCTRR
jgi:hypothetical protein